MTTKEQVELKAKDLMEIYWDCSRDELKSTLGVHAINLAKHVLTAEIKARIDEQKSHGISINYVRIDVLESQLKELES